MKYYPLVLDIKTNSLFIDAMNNNSDDKNNRDTSMVIIRRVELES